MPRSVITIETITSNLIDLLHNDLYLGSLREEKITDTICFDCNMWVNGYSDNEDNILIEPIRDSVISKLISIKDYLNTLLKDKSIVDYGFKSQVQRFLDIVEDLLSKVKSLQCSPYICDNSIMSEFLSVLISTIIQLITILEHMNGLLSYYEYCDCMGSSLFSVLMGKFINSITQLQSYLRDWYNIVMAFFQLMAMLPRGYVASYVPHSTLQVPPFNMPLSHACVPCPPQQKQPIIQRQYVSNNCGCNPCVPFPC